MQANTPSPPPQPDPSPTTTTATTKLSPATKPKNRDFLTHLETYLAKRDGVDKLLKISRYAAKLILSTSPSLSPSHPLTARLKSFDSSVGLSRKAFRLGKFIADVNALRATVSTTADPTTLLLSTIAYGGEGLYYFLEQIVWLSKTGLIDARHARDLQKLSAWAELAGYVGSVGLKLRDLRILGEEKACVESSKEVAAARGGGEVEELRRKESAVRLKIATKRVSIVQDLADGLMALGDIRDGKGAVFSPGVLACAGMVSALISTHKNWVSC